MTDRVTRVYRLDIQYPEGSDAPGWVPACWPEFLANIKDKAQRRALRRRGFRWPREHLYLSASGAWSRAWLLMSFGAEVYVEASDPVTWPEWQDSSANGRGWESGSTAARWAPPEPEVSAADVFREQAAGFWAAYFEGKGPPADRGALQAEGES